MPVTFVKGDFINEPPQGKPRAFACPVDVLGTSDAGIAAAVAKRWPGFGEWWRQQRKQIGDVAVFEPADGRDVIFALVIQRGSKRGKLGWLDRAVRGMLAEATKRGITHINVPRLWGGASGLDGARAKRIIDDAALPLPMQVTVFEQFIRAAEPPPEPEPEVEAAPPAEAPKAKKKAAAKKKTAAKKTTTAKKKAASTTKKKATAPAKKKAVAKKKATSKKKTTSKKRATT
jgi:hypothetical protein